ncbi:MAG: sigma-70 family RNA polymerase sigma factor [Odoribacteraceae bacterium]|jgi:RNA polymerase sigma-70 factor (ECF subfamily)|nr:sigma-70 family RNA polymerase sigma factor [Odoribacteraceae bacterium]
MHTKQTHEQTVNEQNSLTTETVNLNSFYDTSMTLSPQEMEALRNGCHETYTKLFSRFFDPLVGYITVITRSNVMAEDLSQEIMTTVWINRERMNPTKNISGLLFTIARRKINSYYRKQKVHENYLLQLPVDKQCTHATDSFMIAEDMEKYILGIIEQMPEQRRKVFELSYKNGLSADEIAEQLNIMKKSVEKQISYARRTIREKLSSM